MSAVNFYESHSGVTYRSVTAADAESIVRLCLAEFYPRMPLFRHLGVTSAADVATTLALLPAVIAEGVSLLAEDAVTKEALGARMSVVVCATQQQQKHPLLTDPSLAARYPKHSLIARLVSCVESKVDYFSLYPGAERALAFKLLVVKASRGRQGIGRRLVECSGRLARQLGIGLLVGSTESRHSQGIYEALGFQRIAQVDFAEYCDPVTGERPFRGLAEETEHKQAVMFAKLL